MIPSLLKTKKRGLVANRDLKPKIDREKQEDKN